MLGLVAVTLCDLYIVTDHDTEMRVRIAGWDGVTLHQDSGLSSLTQEQMCNFQNIPGLKCR